MRLLLIEILRRHKPLQLLAVIMLAAIWYIAGGETDVSLIAMALGASMSAAFMMGPGRHSMMIPPAVSYLPLSRRDIWRATWLASTVWPTAVATATMLLMMLVPATRTTIGFSRIPLFAAYCFAFVGAGCVLVMFLSAAGSHPRVWRPVRDVITVFTPLVNMAGFYVGYWGVRYLSLPTRWSELSPSGVLCLVSTMGLVTGAYFYAPRVTGNPPLRAGTRQSATERAARPVPPSRLTRLPRLLWNEYAWTLNIAGGIVALAAIVIVVFDTFFNTEGAAAGLARGQLVRLFGQDAASEYGFGAIFWLLMFLVAGVARFGFIIRHLRVLPLTPLQLNALLVAWPAAVLVPIWTALLLMYLTVVRQPVTSLSPGVLLSLIGLSALIRSITLRWQRTFIALVPVFGVLGVVSGLPLSGPPPLVLAVTGMAGLIGAALLNRGTFLRSATYARPRVALGLAPPR